MIRIDFNEEMIQELCETIDWTPEAVEQIFKDFDRMRDRGTMNMLALPIRMQSWGIELPVGKALLTTWIQIQGEPSDPSD